METLEKKDNMIRGGQFIVRETKAQDVFTPEDFSEEQKMMRDSVKEFVDREPLKKAPSEVRAKFFETKSPDTRLKLVP